MKKSRRTMMLAVLGTAGVVMVATAGFVWSGVYNVAADDPHTDTVHSILETLRARSIKMRARGLQVPQLDDPARIVQGSGNYDAMCAGCHLAPGMAETELSQGLYPAPPDLRQHEVDTAEAFWVIKHGIKASGMPAWGRNMDDEYIWNMAAFLQVLPTLDAVGYQAMVADSDGHSHGGGETGDHAHGPAGHHDGAHADSDSGVGHHGDEVGSHAHPPAGQPSSDEGHDHDH